MSAEQEIFHQALARGLDRALNGESRGSERQTGFFLLVFPFNSEGECNYVSNANPADALKFFRYQVARLEGRLGKGGSA